MLLTPHVVTGLAISRKVRWPIAVCILAFFSHFLLDLIPHCDSQSLFGFSNSHFNRPGLLLLVCDIACAVFACWWCYRRYRAGITGLLAAFSAIAVDPFDNIHIGLRAYDHWVSTTWISYLHTACDGGVSTSYLSAGLSSQLLVCTIGCYYAMPLFAPVLVGIIARLSGALTQQYSLLLERLTVRTQLPDPTGHIGDDYVAM